ncbi:response regulator [Sphaerospermopsis aphanizomenoides BCCUSP55]|uniref:ATP-binding protein n=1 Tax=Sphaerospermopsis aphanizomenoides TaxID=459663 RepID=UPI000AFC8022|nr:ATP-binding protein [Sphaerospermopsis aphanizomenoides]MBK1990209.1 response regulator [Sphaerospermopsis aphanizomenoides BCCUSP55]
MEQAKILVVEDEIIVARTISSQLHQLGYIITGTASSGKAALAKALETQPELVLMDIILKGEIDGITTAANIREQLDIPIIFLTAHSDDQTIERAKITQPFGYVVKPFTVTDLRIAIEIALSQHKLERELRESRDQLATLLNCMSDAVIATNEQGIVTYINPAAHHLTAWEQEDALGKNISDVFTIIDEVTEEIIENPIHKTLREEPVVNLGESQSLITKNGQIIPIGNNASPLKRHNKISGAVVVFWDMSERRQKEHLEQALKQEQELNRLKSLFISTVSHEFRNPLAMIQTAVELIEMQGNNLTTTKRNAYFNRIYNAVQSMEKLMEDVLFMGKAEAGYLGYNPAPIKLDKFCRDLIEEFTIIKSISQQILFNCHSHYTDGVMDERLLRYLFINLLSNAVKYSHPGSQIQFNLTCDMEAGVAIFQIQDQGIGIPTADRNRIFDSFYRASNVQSIHGNGLGLVIVKRCVDAHNGKIDISSQVDVGTTFTVTIPLNK